MDFIQLQSFIANLDKNPELNPTEKAILETTQTIVENGKTGLVCSQNDQECYERGKALIESLATNPRFSSDLTMDRYETLLLQELKIKKSEQALLKANWKTLTGVDVPIETFFNHDKVVVIAAWATFCGPCFQEMSELNRLVQEHGDKVTVISLVQGTSGEVERTLKKLEKQKGKEALPQYPIFLTPNLTQAEPYFDGHDAIPRTFIYTSAGELQVDKIGYDPSQTEIIDQALELAQSEKDK